MKTYSVDVDITVSKTFHVTAFSEDDAKRIVDNMFKKDPFHHTKGFDAVVGHKIFDVYED